MDIKTFSTEFCGKTLTIETGHFAQAANASVTVRMGDTTVLVTAVMSPEKAQNLGYFPLMVDFEEKLYAAGRIKGSRFIKREGRPTDEAILVGRFIDRAIRPLFDDRIQNEVQIIVSALSFDGENDPDVLGLIGASCALHMSNIPWNGPIGAVRVSRLGESFIMSPSYEQRLTTEFDLDIAGTHEKVVMIEARGKEAKEEEILKAFEMGREELKPVIKLIEEVRSAVGKEKLDVLAPKNEEEKIVSARRNEIKEKTIEFVATQMDELFFDIPKASKTERGLAKTELKHRLEDHLKAQEATKDEISYATGLIYELVQREVSKRILEKKQRVDGRKIEEIRPLFAEVAVLPRVHGCGHFMRGETQVLSVCTLGAPGDKQTLDGMETVGEKQYMHHYNFPPFSVGEAKPLRGTGRREVGHGALAEKAVECMLPAKEDFPYAIRVVSEVLNSNGSSSMASTCASILALMDAGVPLKKPVAGIAIGLASNEKESQVITDIQDLEDGPGGMDFKITGSADGITAIQMDTKTDGITHDIIEEALRQGKNARLEILKVMTDLIAAPRAELSPFAPRIFTLHINPEKIREVIGPGGKMINEIISKTGVQAIDIEQDGLVMITAKDKKSGEEAYNWVHNLTREVEAGEEFEGEVARIMDFGAFVTILPGKDGLVHVSELAPWRVEKVTDIVQLGSRVHVKVIEIDSMGRVNLSMKQAQGNTYTEEMKAKAQKSSSRPTKPMPKKH
ncbi:MAG: polyribonucleotide nucleotidyltransferase [Patescibacteria group bacterium]|jgi:polyribonucleotide nucleotidyltransferase